MPAIKKSKSAVIKEMFAKGLTSPKEISFAAKKLGYQISPAYVALIKSLEKAKKAKLRW